MQDVTASGYLAPASPDSRHPPKQIPKEDQPPSPVPLSVMNRLPLIAGQSLLLLKTQHHLERIKKVVE